MPNNADVLRERSARTARRVAAQLSISDAADVMTLRDAYLVAYEFPAPLMVRVADTMLADLRDDIAVRKVDRIVALGRDGHHLALAMRQLDGQFFGRHGANLVLSRILVENALQDLERHQGLAFPQLQAFRGAAGRVDPADTVGGLRMLTDYLHDEGVPVGRPGSRVTVVDTSFKGSVQELLAAVYPETEFIGRYAFYGESPDDPHPGSKKGYEVHLPAAETQHGRALDILPADESKTFAHRIALHSIEKLLNGPMSSPERIGERGPEQSGQRHDPELLRGLRPARVSARLRDPRVREGVKVVNLKAVEDLARDIAVLRDAGGNYRGWLDDWSGRYRREIRAWIGGGATDARLAEVLDSFVYRADNQQVEALQKTLDRAQVPERDRQAIWESYERCGSDSDKRVFVENVFGSMRRGGGGGGRGQGRGSGGRVDGARLDDRER
ncbi:ABC transporter permease [Kribbella sindirgiensis]|uniref:ABC transporter permease n=1 Tax=Kribbella sindirgiensis TaxID=1124744 RepID=A0A4R0HXZ2_9ACTN|nr:ABC transporter permease [Kribbella sindirgiensis]TCC17937.1 ABC transporter permease [Kribbella sindirgiensis]